jgi:uncharacterized membrane protein YbhN (UPF0104 family)
VNEAREALGAVSGELASLDARWLGVALLFHLGNLACRTLAWRAILAAAYPRARIRVLDVGAAYAVGVAANAYLPARAGEAVKVALVRLRVSGSTVAGVGSSGAVVLLFDGLVAASLLATGWATGVVPVLPSPSLPAVLVVAGATLAAAVALAAAPRLRAAVLEGATILRTPRRYLATVVPFQAAAWACRIGVVFALLSAFGVAASLPLAGLVVVAGGLSTAVPATPGGAGTQQLLVVLALQHVASAGTALTFSIGMQIGVTVTNTLLGVAALVLCFRTLRRTEIRAALARAS